MMFCSELGCIGCFGWEGHVRQRLKVDAVAWRASLRLNGSVCIINSLLAHLCTKAQRAVFFGPERAQGMQLEKTSLFRQ